MSRSKSWIEPAGARRSSPEIAAISSCWPLPETPAMPTTSPARTSNEMSSSAVPNGSSLASERPRTASTTAPGVASRCCSCGGSAPIIRRERLALVSFDGSTSPVTLPPRSTVQWWQSARISSSLCEM